jgi:hypothetical protein
MEINITQEMRKNLMIFLMVLLPLILIVLGAISGITNAGYYILSILWFGMGVFFFGAIY